MDCIKKTSQQHSNKNPIITMTICSFIKEKSINKLVWAKLECQKCNVLVATQVLVMCPHFPSCIMCTYQATYSCLYYNQYLILVVSGYRYVERRLASTLLLLYHCNTNVMHFTCLKFGKVILCIYWMPFLCIDP